MITVQEAFDLIFMNMPGAEREFLLSRSVPVEFWVRTFNAISPCHPLTGAPWTVSPSGERRDHTACCRR